MALVEAMGTLLVEVSITVTVHSINAYYGDSAFN